ncbi:anti-sigma factor antagonist [Mycolicibacterium parafortuitum]
MTAPERMGLLDIEQDVRDAAVVVRAHGEVDTSTAGELTGALENAVVEAAAHPARLVVLELDGIVYFGSAGLNALLTCCELGDAKGVAVRLVATTPEVLRPIEVTRLDSVLRPYPSLDDAVAAPEERR